jgi:glycosyltransferase involved in cell wall biosynthesis
LTRVPVVHVITLLELGGAQQNTLDTVARLDRARFAPQLVCGEGGVLDDEARALPDVPVTFLPDLVRPIHALRDLRAVARLTTLLAPMAAAGLVLVHTHGSKAGIVGRAAAARAHARPVVHSIHGFGHAAIPAGPLRWAALMIERRMARRTDAFIAVARASVEKGRRLGLLGDRPAHLVRSGIDVGTFAQADALRDQARTALGIPPRAPVVGSIGNMKPQKAPLDFVEIAAAVARERPDARFFIAGDGELRRAVERLIDTRGLAGRLVLLGWRRDVPALLGALDVLVLTSRWEGLPRVCPQAMAAGRPVVATNVDGIPEAIVHGRNGFLFEPGDIEAGAAHVLALLRDEAARRRLAAAGRAAVGEFDVGTMIAAQEQLYDSLLDCTARPAGPAPAAAPP